jgi:putative endonuclease
VAWFRDNDVGSVGERVAANWLVKERGFVVVARNWRNPRDRRDELDLVCRDGDVLVFVEVKARAVDALVPGYFAVDRRKKRIMRRVIDAYLHQLSRPPHTFRFDVVEVSVNTRGAQHQILHFENVVLFPKQYRG